MKWSGCTMDKYLLMIQLWQGLTWKSQSLSPLARQSLTSIGIVSGILTRWLIGMQVKSQRGQKYSSDPSDSWAISERIHWVNFSEEGSCCKNRAKVSCNSSSIKPRIRRCPKKVWGSSTRVPIDYHVGRSPLIDSRAVLTIWIAHATWVTPWVSEWEQGWRVAQGRSRIKSRS